jgi:hypothetical protein
MKVYECCPFFNELLVARLKLEESKGWVDELHVAEADHTFKYTAKPYVWNIQNERVHHLKVRGEEVFRGAQHWGISRRFPFLRKKSSALRNETVQRNLSFSKIDPQASDIVILADIDEIIDSRFADRITEATKRHEIITVPLHFTMYYLDLFSVNWHEVWPGSPSDYAYRVFVMTGEKFNSLPMSPDRLRKLGEVGKLCGSVHRFEEIAGFHHSWLGDERAIASKMKAYSHEPHEHSQALHHCSDEDLHSVLRERLRCGQSLFDGHRLEIRDETQVSFLRSVIALAETLRPAFLRQDTAQRLVDAARPTRGS